MLGAGLWHCVAVQHRRVRRCLYDLHPLDERAVPEAELQHAKPPTAVHVRVYRAHVERHSLFMRQSPAKQASDLT